jgi:hypothetical protein
MKPHSPTPFRRYEIGRCTGCVPYILDRDGMIIAQVHGQVVFETDRYYTKNEENLAFILRACNCHEEMVSALRLFESISSIPRGQNTEVGPEYQRALTAVRAVLSKIEAPIPL